MIEESQLPSDSDDGYVDKFRQGLKSVSVRDVVDVLSKVVVVCVGGCYVIGLLIVNLHLRRYAFFNLGFLQVDYVMAGAVWLFLMGLIVAFALYILSKLAAIGEDIAKRDLRQAGARIAASAVYVVVAFSIIVYALILLSDHSLHILSIMILKVLGVLLLNIGGLFLLSIAAGEVVVGHTLVPKKAFIRIGDYFRAFVYVALFLAVLSTYSSYVFPLFSPAFGGGKPRRAEFIVKTNSVAMLTTMGIPIESDSRRSASVGVIFEGSDFFLIEAPADLQEKDKVRSIRLDKSLTEAVLYLAGN